MPSVLKIWATETDSPSLSKIDWLCHQITQQSTGEGSSNLEQALTALEAAPNERVKLTDGTWFYTHLLLGDLADMIAMFFDSRRTDANSRAYRILASEVIRPGDAVITFNYDVTLEKELAAVGKWDVGTGYGFPIFPDRNSPVQILKLHGSTNWMPLTDGHLGGGTYNPVDPFGYRPMIPDAELQWLGFSGLSDPLLSTGNALLGAPRRHTLLLPTLAKKFPGRMWTGLWIRAKEILGDSSRVAMLGYSLPEADEMARTLILGQCRRDARIVLRCRSRTNSLAAEFHSAGFGSIDGDDTRDFEKWLDEEANPGSEGRRSSP